MVSGGESGGGFSLVEHPMAPRPLAPPLHRHSREDEYSFVLEGRAGAMLGEEVLYGQPGDLIFKPRHQWHTFWNAGDQPARILEIISQPDSNASSRSSPILPLSTPESLTPRNATRSPSATASRWTSTAFQDCSQRTDSHSGSRSRYIAIVTTRHDCEHAESEGWPGGCSRFVVVRATNLEHPLR